MTINENNTLKTHLMAFLYTYLSCLKFVELGANSIALVCICLQNSLHIFLYRDRQPALVYFYFVQLAK